MYHASGQLSTTPKSWYPKPEKSLHFLQVPVVKLLPALQMSQDDCEILRNWAKAHGAAVRQRTVRQETTMVKQGTLPEYMYQRKNILTERVHVFSDCHPNTGGNFDVSDDQFSEASDAEMSENFDEVDEFDSSSDEDDEEELRHQQANHDEIGKSTFYLGHGHAVEEPFDLIIGCSFK